MYEPGAAEAFGVLIEEDFVISSEAQPSMREAGIEPRDREPLEEEYKEGGEIEPAIEPGLESEPSAPLSYAEQAAQAVMDMYGGEDMPDDYQGPNQGGGPPMFFDGENLFENDVPVGEWGAAMIEAFTSGNPYIYEYKESRGEDEYMCYGIGILDETNHVVWVNFERNITRVEEKPIVDEEPKADEAEAIIGDEDIFSDEDDLVAEEPDDALIAMEAEAYASVYGSADQNVTESEVSAQIEGFAQADGALAAATLVPAERTFATPEPSASLDTNENVERPITMSGESRIEQNTIPAVERNIPSETVSEIPYYLSRTQEAAGLVQGNSYDSHRAELERIDERLFGIPQNSEDAESITQRMGQLLGSEPTAIPTFNSMSKPEPVAKFVPAFSKIAIPQNSIIENFTPDTFLENTTKLKEDSQQSETASSRPIVLPSVSVDKVFAVLSADQETQRTSESADATDSEPSGGPSYPSDALVSVDTRSFREDPIVSPPNFPTQDGTGGAPELGNAVQDLDSTTTEVETGKNIESEEKGESIQPEDSIGATTEHTDTINAELEEPLQRLFAEPLIREEANDTEELEPQVVFPERNAGLAELFDELGIRHSVEERRASNGAETLGEQLSAHKQKVVNDDAANDNDATRTTPSVTASRARSGDAIESATIRVRNGIAIHMKKAS